MSIPIPTYIGMCKPWLQANTVASQPAQIYHGAKWRDSFQDSGLDTVLSRHPESITRADLAELGRNVHESGTDPGALRCFFWGVMLWGWSTAGVGPTRVGNILKGEQPFEQLTVAFKWVQQDNLAAAYQVLRTNQAAKIKYFDEAYFSKFLYFAGLGCNLLRYPLILDSKVLASLGALVDPKSLRAHNLDSYLNYVTMLHDWADQLGCRADSIEYLLYLLPLEFWKG